MHVWSAVCDLKHERSGRVADKARDEAECFIRHETTSSSTVNCILHDQAHTLTGLSYCDVVFLPWTAIYSVWLAQLPWVVRLPMSIFELIFVTNDLKRG